MLSLWCLWLMSSDDIIVTEWPCLANNSVLSSSSPNSPCSYTQLYRLAARLPTPYLNHNIHCTTPHTHTLSSIPSPFPSRPHTRLSPHKTALHFSCQSYLVSVHKLSGGMTSPPLREAMLPRATVLCYIILRWGLWYPNPWTADKAVCCKDL